MLKFATGEVQEDEQQICRSLWGQASTEAGNAHSFIDRASVAHLFLSPLSFLLMNAVFLKQSLIVSPIVKCRGVKSSQNILFKET